MLNQRAFYINGDWVPPRVANDFAVINPATENEIAVISLGDQADTDAAVAAARGAFVDWSRRSRSERLNFLKAISVEYERRLYDMAVAISNEMGAPITLARRQQAPCGLRHINNFIEALEKFKFETALEGLDNERIIQEPIGVAGLITPWNWPMNQVCLKVIPALAVGCTVVLKPSELAPLSSIVFSEILHAAGCPAGVFNCVNGDGVGVGRQLSTHTDVDMISFTGSVRAGREITIAAAETVKRVTLELGGKGANIIYADADAKAVKRGTLHAFNNSGQSCNAPTRMLVERPIYQKAVQIATEIAQRHSCGNPLDEGRHMGPVISKIQFDKIQNLIATGIEQGARLTAGGCGRPKGIDKGYFVRPTVFADVDNSMTIAREEIFGPVLTIIPFDNEEQAIAIANDTPYGLTNYIQTGDRKKAQRTARALHSGMIRINGDGGTAAAPFGGYKQSGNGREGGHWGLKDFLEIKHVTGW